MWEGTFLSAQDPQLNFVPSVSRTSYPESTWAGMLYVLHQYIGSCWQGAPWFHQSTPIMSRLFFTPHCNKITWSKTGWLDQSAGLNHFHLKLQRRRNLLYWRSTLCAERESLPKYSRKSETTVNSGYPYTLLYWNSTWPPRKGQGASLFLEK